MATRRRALARPVALALGGLLLAGGPGCRHPAGPATAAPTCPEPAASAGPGRDPAALASERQLRAEALVERARRTFDVPGLAVAVTRGEEIVFEAGVGELVLGEGRPVTAETSFAIASNTKAFTATALGLLVAEGRLGWDDKVVDHLPDLVLWDPYVTQQLTVRDLVSHRVGLATWAGDLMWLSSRFDVDTVLARLRFLPPSFSLRERYGYCNLMYIVAGRLIERHAGMPWDAFVRARILGPAGMDGVATQHDQLVGRADVAAPHILVDGRWQTTPYLDLRTVGPAASMHASARDLARWLILQANDGAIGGRQVIPAAVIRETRQPQIWLRTPDDDPYVPARSLIGYGLGWFLADYRGELMVWHGGGMPGMTSRTLIFPRSKLGVVVLTSSESPVSGWLALALAELWLLELDAPREDYLAKAAAAGAAPEPSAPPPERELEPALGQRLRGGYRNPMLGRAEIAEADGGWWFVAHEHGGLRCRLYARAPAGEPEGQDELWCRWDDPNMQTSRFSLEREAGKIRALSFKVRPDFYDPLEYRFTR